jgi:hypothetical protein
MSVTFDLRDVLEWALTKPADEAYDYGDPGGCAIARFLRETGRVSLPVVGEFYWRNLGDELGRRLPAHLDDLVFADRDVSQRTFGALTSRIEALVVPA